MLTEPCPDPDPIEVGTRTLPVGFGIIIGACISLVMIGVTKGRTKWLMMFWTAFMTAFVGAVSVATPENITPVMYPIIMFASIGVGGVIIPASIIAQIVCPVELIGTITAITLSIRYIGGAIGFTAYYNVLYHKFIGTASTYPIGTAIVQHGIATNYTLIVELITYAGQAQYADLQHLIATNDGVMKKDEAFDVILAATQTAFSYAYRWPYWISIAFGASCFICACFCRDVRRFM